MVRMVGSATVARIPLRAGALANGGEEQRGEVGDLRSCLEKQLETLPINLVSFLSKRGKTKQDYNVAMGACKRMPESSPD